MEELPRSQADRPKSLARQAETEKYDRAYQGSYGMSDQRMRDAVDDLNACFRGSYLDIGCGRGEMLDYASENGFSPVMGVEVVEKLTNNRVIQAQAHDLPFASKSFDVVSLFDVIEHLLPGDDEAVCREMDRIATHDILLTACNTPSYLPDGTDLHINKRPYDEWDRLFRKWFSGEVTWLQTGKRNISQGWHVLSSQ